MEAKNKKDRLNKDSLSYSELNKIRAKSVDTIRKIRKKVNFENINGVDNTIDTKYLRTPQENF